MLKCDQLNFLSDATNSAWIGPVVFEISTFKCDHLLLWKTIHVHHWMIISPSLSLQIALPLVEMVWTRDSKESRHQQKKYVSMVMCQLGEWPNKKTISPNDNKKKLFLHAQRFQRSFSAWQTAKSKKTPCDRHSEWTVGDGNWMHKLNTLELILGIQHRNKNRYLEEIHRIKADVGNMP
jgi:hypothetical protein